MTSETDRAKHPQFPKSQSTRSTHPLIFAGTLVAIIAVTLAWSPATRTLLGQRLLKPLSSIGALSSVRAMSTTTAMSAVSTPPATSKPYHVSKRPWNARGHADHSWLYTFHTFSFASYHDPAFESFGPLRVINEDRVQHGTGFGTHGHAEFLIWSYIVSGELEHRDSMGNVETLRRGEVQFTSAGTGIRHSEHNRHKRDDVHFLQIWARPAVRGLAPEYVTRAFPDELKRDRLVRVMDSVDRPAKGLVPGDPAPIAMHADLSMSAGIISPGGSVTHTLVADGPRKVYAHVVMTGREQPRTGGARIRLGDVELGEGDGAFVHGASGPGEVVITSTGDTPAEILLFDMGS